jgi:aerobic C4-dicarboxylate transport protein
VTAMRLLRQLWFQVLIGVVVGSVFGMIWPHAGARMEPVATGFIRLITMLISPIIFSAIIVGIGSVSDLRKVGWVGLKALIYFEIVTTAALVIGLFVVDWIKPGAGIHATAASLGAGVPTAKPPTVVDFFLNIIPHTMPGALTSGEILQVLLVSILIGCALTGMGETGRKVTEGMEVLFKIMMRVVNIIVCLAPLASFAAMAFIIGKYGIGSLRQLASLMLCILITMVIFIVAVLGAVLRMNGIGLWSFLRYLRNEIVLVLGTSSSETALPGLMQKMEDLGCSETVVGLVVPAGYSFNLDGTSIYLTMAALFIAQATDTRLTLGQQFLVLLLLMATSKGAAAVTGGGFIALQASLGMTPVPAGGLSLVIGIDRFLSLARALVNLIGNAVAVVTVAAWEGELDRERAKRMLSQ